MMGCTFIYRIVTEDSQITSQQKRTSSAGGAFEALTTGSKILRQILRRGVGMLEEQHVSQHSQSRVGKREEIESEERLVAIVKTRFFCCR